NRSAAYYLLKPIEITELVAAVNKVQESILREEVFSRNNIILQNLRLGPGQQQIVLPTLQGFDVVKTATITRLVAKGNFTEVYFTDGSHKLICKFLKHFDEILERPFLRIHRSFIVNLQFIKSFSKTSGGCITMQDGSEMEVSASYKDEFLKSLGI
ncbi:MAG: LytTR family DNA-binding domain-containing protein, partial [Ferruginibacter sp.]